MCGVEFEIYSRFFGSDLPCIRGGVRVTISELTSIVASVSRFDFDFENVSFFIYLFISCVRGVKYVLSAVFFIYLFILECDYFGVDQYLCQCVSRGADDAWFSRIASVSRNRLRRTSLRVLGPGPRIQDSNTGPTLRSWRSR